MKYDLIVIGAGPAGAACAISAAQRGLHVLLLHRAGAAPRPGESLHPGIEPVLNRLGVNLSGAPYAFQRYSGINVRWRAPLAFMPFGQDKDGIWQGWQIPGSVLDTLLLTRAAQLGVVIKSNVRLLRPLRTKESVTGVITHSGAFHAPFTVDATGRTRWLAKQLGLHERPFSPFLLSTFGYVQGAAPPLLDNPLLLAEPTGWCWMAKIADNRYHWMRLLFSKDEGKRLGAPAALQPLAVQGKTRFADVTWRITTPAAGPGYFLVGDAAWLLDPASSHGVLKALLSGMRAAEDIASVLLFPRHETAIVEGYSHWCRQWFNSDKAEMLRAYAEHPFPPSWLPPTP